MLNFLDLIILKHSRIIVTFRDSALANNTNAWTVDQNTKNMLDTYTQTKIFR